MIYTTLLILITYVLASSKEDQEYDKQLEQEWNRRMKDFVPNDYLTV